MTNKKRILTIATCGLLAIGAVTASAIFLPLIAKPKTTNDNNLKLMTNEDWLNHKPFKFNNKTYLNLNDALNDYLKEIGGISNQQFVGKLSSSNIEPNGLVNTNNSNFYKYDINKVSSAYKDANGNFTESYQKALESFINDSNVVTKYYDYKGNFFKDERNAKISMDQISSMPTVFYKINDYNNKVNNINPLNPKDQLALKKIAFDFIQNGGKYSNGLSSPFNFISILKYNIEGNNSDSETKISKEKNIFNYGYLVDAYNEFVEKFKNNFSRWMLNQITKILSENNLISVSITINPYSTEFVGKYTNSKGEEKYIPDFSSNLIPEICGDCYTTQDYNFNVAVKKIEKGKEKEEIKPIKVLDSKESVNLKDFNEIYEIFTNKTKFESDFDMEYSEIVSSQRFEYANIKSSSPDRSIFEKCFPNLKSIKYKKLHPWYSKRCSDYECKILEPSDKHEEGGIPWHEWKNNSMITFGVSAYLTGTNKKELLGKISNCFDSNSKTISLLVNKAFDELILKYNKEDHPIENKAFKYLRKLLNDKYGDPKYYFTFSQDEGPNTTKYDIATNLTTFFNNIKDNVNDSKITNIMHPEIQDRKFSENEIKESSPCLLESTLKKVYGSDYESNKDKIKYSVDYAYREYMTPNGINGANEHVVHISNENNKSIFKIDNENLALKNIINENKVDISGFKDAVRILGLFEDGIDSNNRNGISNELATNFYKIIENFTNIDLSNKNLFDNLKINKETNKSKLQYDLSQDSYDFFITYNDVPLYKINHDMLLATQAINYNNVSMKDKEILINNWLNKKNYKEIETKIGNDKLEKFIDEFLINVSSNVGFENPTSRTNFEYDPNDKKLEIEQKVDSKSYIKIVNKNTARSQDNNNQIDVGELGHKVRIYNDGINSIVRYYNKNLSKIQVANDEFSKLLTKDIFVDNEKKLDNVVVLYKRDIVGKTFEDLVYAEVPWSTNNLNISLIDPNNCSVLATTLEEWKKIAERYKAFTTPAPIHFIYTSKSIINKIFVPNFDNMSPNFIDSIDVIVSNALRNYQIEPDKKMVMYQVKKGRYEPVENQVFNLYQCIINQRKFHFDSLEHANNALIEYIKLNSYLAEETK